MATLSAQGTLPASGAEVVAEPLADTFTHIINTLNGNNLDENNVDYTSSDGIATLQNTQTFSAAKTFSADVTLSGGDGALTFGAAGSVKIPDNEATSLVIEEADNAYLTFVTTNSSEKIVSSKPIEVGINGTGHDVKFFGDTPDQFMLWDQSTDELVLAGDTKLSFHDAAGGENIIASSDGNLQVNSGTTLVITAPTVDLNSATEFNIDTAAYDLNASGAVTIDGAGVSIDSSSASNFTTSGGALTLASAAATTWRTVAGALTVNGENGINIQEGGSDIITISDARAIATANTASIDLNATGAMTLDSAGISLDSSDASNFTTSSGALTLTSAAAATWSTAAGALTLTSAAAATWSTSAGALTVNGAGGVNIREGGSDIITISDSRALATANTASINLDASGVVAIESTGGSISIGDDNYDQVVNLATKGTRTLNIGINDGTDVTTLAVKGNTTNTGTITVGVDGTGYDVKFFGDTSGKYMQWDQDEDALLVSGDIRMIAHNNRIDLDANNNTSIRASADDTIMFELAGADDFSITANSLNILSGSVIDLADNAPVQFGDADDASIKWDATNLAIAAGSADVKITASNVIPATNDGSALGVSGTAWADLFLASGSVVDFNTGDVTLTHASNLLTVGGGNLHVADGQGVVIGHTAQVTAHGTVAELQVIGGDINDSAIILGTNKATSHGNWIIGYKSRNTTPGSSTAAQSGDDILNIAGVIDDGTDYANMGAQIQFQADGNASNNNTPGRIIFKTTATSASSPTERMRINNAGNIGIGVAPDAWRSDYSAIDIGSNGGLAGKTTSGAGYQVWLSNNCYNDSTSNTWKFKQGSDEAVAVTLADGAVYLLNELDTGSADATATMDHRWRFQGDGMTFINGGGGTFPSANAHMATGLTIYQGTHDSEIISLKSSDIAHGTTAFTETNTYGIFKKADGDKGALQIIGLDDASGPEGALQLRGIVTSGNTNKDATGWGMVHVIAQYQDGTGVSNATGDQAAFSVGVGLSEDTRFIVDEDGDVYWDGSSAAYDQEDDIALCRAVSYINGGSEVIKTRWDNFCSEHEDKLVQLGVFGGPRYDKTTGKLLPWKWTDENGKSHGRGLISGPKLSMLHNGAINQLYTTLMDTVERLELAESKLKMLEA